MTRALISRPEVGPVVLENEPGINFQTGRETGSARGLISRSEVLGKPKVKPETGSSYTVYLFKLTMLEAK